MTNLYAIAAFAAVLTPGAEDIKASVDGDIVIFPDIQPVMMNARVMVPVRGVFEHLNATVMWDAEAGLVTARRGNDIIKLPTNEPFAIVNGKRVQLDAPARVHGERTVVPLRFLSEALGAKVEWNPATYTVEILTRKGVVDPERS